MIQCSSCKTWLGMDEERHQAVKHDIPLICPVSGLVVSVHKTACPHYELGMTTADYIARRKRVFLAYSSMGYDTGVPK